MDTLHQFDDKPATTYHGCLACTKVNVKENGEHVYCVKYSNDGKIFAATFGNGCCRLFDAQSLTPITRVKLGPQHDDLPSTSVKFRPRPVATEENKEAPQTAAPSEKKTEEEPDEDDKEEIPHEIYQFASCSSAGAIYGWKCDPTEGSGTIVERAWRHLEGDASKGQENDISCIDFSLDGALLASGGSDKVVRLYDCETKKLIDTMSRGHDEQGHGRPAHTNRIFCTKFASQTSLITAGWENPIQIWDLRTHKVERQLQGPSVNSDSVEIMSGTQRALIASNRNSNQLQVYDFVTGQEVITESKKFSSQLGKMPLTSVRYVKETQSIWAIASKPDAILYIDANTGEVQGIIEAEGPLYSLDAGSHNPTRAIFGGSKETILVVDLVPEGEEGDE